MRFIRHALVLALLTSVLIPYQAQAAGGGGSSTGIATGDFDGDGFDDTAIGVPGDTPGGGPQAGAVNVLYGSGSGLSAAADDYWHQDVAGVPGDPASGESFGTAVAAGRFDDDRFDDLAIGTPQDVNAPSGEIAGSVTILYGSASGLRTEKAKLWTEDSPGIAGETNDGDEFGNSLVVGDFGRSGHDDLAIGTPGEILSPSSGDITPGSVHVLYGTDGGLKARNDQVWHQNRAGIGEEAESGESFGASLAAADFGGSAKDDLAIGVPHETHSGSDLAGLVHVLYGGSEGLRSSRSQIWRQGDQLPDEAEDFDFMGWSLAAGNLGKGPSADLAIGVPLEKRGSEDFAGMALVLYGRDRGLSARGSQGWDASRFGRAPTSENVGNGLLIADLYGSPHGDLVIGSEFGDAGSTLNAGSLDVLRGSGEGLKAAGHERWHQDSPGLLETAESFDGFGLSLAAGDLGKSGARDLLVGAPSEDLVSTNSVGVMHAVYGRRAGLSARGDQVWHQDSPGVRGIAQTSESFSSWEMSTD